MFSKSGILKLLKIGERKDGNGGIFGIGGNCGNSVYNSLNDGNIDVAQIIVI